MILKLLGLQRLLDELFEDNWLEPVALIEVWCAAAPPPVATPCCPGWPSRWRLCKVWANYWPCNARDCPAHAA